MLWKYWAPPTCGRSTGCLSSSSSRAPPLVMSGNALSASSSSRTACAFSVLAVDFDDTFTSSDTTPLLPRIAAYSRPGDAPSIERCWADLTSSFLSHHAQVMAELLAIPPGGKSPRTDLLETFLAQLGHVDKESMERVSRSGVLAGLTHESIKRALLGPLRSEWGTSPGAICTLQRAAAGTMQCHVVSVNLSKDVVGTILGEALGDGENGSRAFSVASNDLEFDSSGKTTGNILVHVGGAIGKRQRFTEIASQSEGQSVYVGDSATDILAMLSADCGIVMGNSSAFRFVAESFGIVVMPLTQWKKRDHRGHASVPVVYRAGSWSELEAFLHGGCHPSS